MNEVMEALPALALALGLVLFIARDFVNAIKEKES